MDISKGLLIPEEKEKQCQQSWIPITPAKPMPSRPQTIPGETTGDHPGATKSFQDLLCQERFYSDFPTSAASFSSVVGVVETALGNKDRGDFRHDQAEWSKLPCRDLLALAEAASGASGASSSVTDGGRNNAASTTFVPGSSHSYYQTGSNLQQPESASLNQSLPSSSSMLNFNWPSHNGLPVPHRPIYDLNSLPSTSNMVYDVPVAFQFEPITPDHSKRAKIHQGYETAHASLDEQRYQENRQQKEVTCCAETNVPELSCNMPGSTSVEFSSAALPSPMKDIHLAGKGEGQGIDLNTPPQSQKPKRRKHRPKVVIEGKPKRASKPRNPKQGGNTEKPTVKRKYVRKTAQKAADSTPVNCEKDTVNSTPESAARSSKRALNFDLEAQARDERIKTRNLVEQQDFPHWGFSSNSERNRKDLCIGVDGDTLTKSMQQHTQGWEVIVENPTAQTAFDLNHYSTQKLDDSITCPETPSSETPRPTEKAHRKEYLKVQPKNTNVTSTAANGTTFVSKQIVAEGTTCVALPAKTAPCGAQTTPTSIAAECLNRAENGLLVTPVLAEGTACIALPANTVPCGVQSTSTSQQNKTCSTVAEVRGSKREHCSMMNNRQLSSTSLLGAQFNSLQVYHEIFHKIHKKKRTVKEHNTVASSTVSSNRSAEPSERRAISYGPSNFNATNVQSQTNNVQPSPPFNDTIITADARSGFSNSERDLYAHSMPAGRNSQVQNGYAQLSCVDMLNGGRYDVSSELMLAYGQRGRTTKMRSKVLTRARNLASLTAIVNCNQLQPARAKKEPVKSTRKQIEINRGPLACMQALAVDSHANMTKKKRTRKGVPQATSASYLCTNQPWLQNRWATSYQRPRLSARSRGTSRAKYNNRVTVNQLVHRFKCLSINTGGGIIKMHEQTAMVPFKRNDAMVPYEGPFDPKRRRPRAKVDLDPESDRVWKLLMGKECRLSIEGTKEDNEKWWAEERRVFSLKVDAFIARMHLVLGDRRFTPWKGSVVDSCIGVFLTQNVSDHLSSSAFMSLSSKYPRKETDIIVEEPEISTPDLDVTLDSRDMRLFEQMCEQAYSMAQEGIEHIEETEVAECSNVGGCKSPDNSEGMQLGICKRLENHMTGTRNSWLVDTESKRQLEDVVSSQNSVASSENSASSASCQKTENSATLTPNCTGLSEAKSKILVEEVVSSQNSVFSSQSSELSILQTTEPIGSCSGSNSEAEDMISGCKSNNLDSTAFRELLQMSGSTMLQEYYTRGCGNISPENKPESVSTRSESVITQSEWTGSRGSNMEDQDTLNVSIHSVAPSNFKLPTPEVPSTCSSNYHLQMSQEAGIKEFEHLEVSNEEGKLPSLSTASGIADVVGVDCFSKLNCRSEEAASGSTVYELTSSAQVAASSTSQSKTVVHPLCISRDEVCLQIHSCKSFQAEIINNFEPESTPYVEINNNGEELAQMNGGTQQAGAGSSKFSKEILSVEETMHMTAEGQTTDKDKLANSSNTASNKTTVKKLKANEKPVKENQSTFDWDSLRKEAYRKGTKRERNRDSMDTLDYEALRRAEVNEIAHAIKERGMNNMLAERIKDFLDRLVRDHGSVDLEWLKDVPPDKAKEFLLSIRGLGLKSVECVRLLTLHQLAFPVDTNVGRIAVRLGWVPLQPLPESLQLHLLELYPMQETIQKYLWPRLCTLDQKTLYELHYQMITFGKVFCTKNKPNCNACPLRADCRHFASAFASARLALPAPEEKGMVPSTFPIAADQHPAVDSRPMQITLPQTNDVAATGSPSREPNNVLVTGSILQEPKDVHDNGSILLSTNLISETGSKTNACDPIIEHPATPRSRTIECEPIIEEPASPEMSSIDILERDIEDAFYEDPDEDEIPTINLNIEQFTMNLQSYILENNMGIEGEEMSKALVALTPEAAALPVPKLKNVSRLRTEHEVYVLPDDHPLLAGMEKRDPNDPGTYLLAIWTPGETPESTRPPERCFDSQESHNLCNKRTCFSCSSILESNSQIVRGTLLIPCRTAMRGSFPLNGTYFQVNEVFADHASSISPIHVPRELLWKLPRRTVYFGTSVPSIFKGLSMEAIQSCFWRGYVCVRGFDQKTRAPRPLKARLHFTASRLKQEVKRAE